MNPNPEIMTPTYTPSRSDVVKPRSKKSSRVLKLFLFVFLWAAIISAGAFAMHVYMERLIDRVEADLHAQTMQQMAQLEQTYTERLNELKQSVTGELAGLQSEVETFNEMLTFAEDLAGSKTDESNKLYTRLEQLEAHLKELSKNLELLK